MAVIYGTREVATIGPRKHLTFTYPAPQEQSPGSLPLLASEPSPQFSFTIGAGDIPAITGIAPSLVLVAPTLYVAGQNLDSGVHDIHMAVYLNGSQILGKTRQPSPAAYWMCGLFPGGAIAAGDVLDVAVWADDLGALTVDFGGMGLIASQPRASAGGNLLLNVQYQTTATVDVPTFTTSGIVNTINQNGEVKTVGFPGGGPATDKPALIVDPNEPIFVAFYDGTFDNDNMVGAAQREYSNGTMPTTISYYPTSIRVV